VTIDDFLIEIMSRKGESNRHFPLGSDRQPSQNGLLYLRQNACGWIGKTIIKISRSPGSKSRERCRESPAEIVSVRKLRKEKRAGMDEMSIVHF
jgi:hypothetical protein